jgi:hypothetical protein
MSQLDFFPEISNELSKLARYLTTYIRNYHKCPDCNTVTYFDDSDVFTGKQTSIRNSTKFLCDRCSTMRSKNKHYKRNYKLSYQEVHTMLMQQGFKCKCCSKEIDMPTDAADRSEAALVDHCHDTGKVRGIICGRCNTGIGQLGDNLEGVMKAVRYLEDSDDTT